MSERFKVLVCRGPHCSRRGSHPLMEELVSAIQRGRVPGIRLGWQSCFGRCTQGPNVLVQTARDDRGEPTFVLAPPPSRGRRACMYNHVQVRDIAEIVSSHLHGGTRVRRLIQKPVRTKKAAPEGTD